MEGSAYEDILHLPYPDIEIEKDFPDKVLRAAQFAPFAALTGYDAAVAETARLTEDKLELDQDIKEHLDAKLQILREYPGHGLVTVTYFVPDSQKEGGSYAMHTGVVVKIKEYERELFFEDGTVIVIENIAAIEGALFEEY